MHILEFKYCPNCKGILEKEKEYTFCPSCKNKFYYNPTPAVAILPVKDGKVLLSKRGIEPFKGDYDVLGGFISFNETAEESAKREIMEEIGLKIKSMIFFKTYVDTYGPGGEHTLGIFFVAELEKGEPKPTDDVSDCIWIPVEDLHKIRSGFKSVEQSLKDFQKWYRNNPLTIENL